MQHRTNPSSLAYRNRIRAVRQRFQEADHLRRAFGLLLAPMVCALMLMTPAPEGMSPEAWKVTAVLALMMLWWMTEALPLAVTALMPVVLFPMLEVASMPRTAMNYGNPVVFLFMGGFILALAMEKWNLHLRIALNILKAVGSNANIIIGGFMASTAFLSMWMSNTATVVMMLPMAVSVVNLLLKQTTETNAKGAHHFAVSMMLGLAYAASIGGSATLIGTPPNAVLNGFIRSSYGYNISFAGWMLLAVPLCAGLLFLAWLVLTKLVFPNGLGRIAGADALVEEELSKLGSMSRGERTIALLFGGTALLWMFQEPLNNLMPLHLTDSGIAMLGAILCFMVPVHFQKGEFVLTWKEAEKLPWGILLLFGGGMTLAGIAEESGLAQWVGQELSDLSNVPFFALLFVVVLAMKILTEFMGNVAAISAFLPILSALAVATDTDPLLLMVPSTFAVSFAFMTPIGTPPNAIVFGSGHLHIADIAKAGLWLNIAVMAVIPLVCYYLAIPLLKP